MHLNKKLFVAAGALAAVTLCAAPLSAQRGQGDSQGRGDGQGRGQSQGQSRSGGDRRTAPASPGRQGARQPQAQRPQAQAAPPAQVQRSAPAQRPQADARQVQPRQGAAAPAYRNAAPSYRNTAPSYRNTAPSYRGTAPAYRNAAPAYRGTVAPRNDNYRGSLGYHTPRYYSQPRYLVHPYVVRRPVFVQPYYAFRPSFSLSFGIHVGYGVAYPFSSWDPYAFYNYRLGIAPGYNSRTYYNRVGGLSFQIDPYDAEVYVDGDFVGYASDFAPEQMPLTLLSGRHHVDLAAPGYEDVSFDITVVPGQVIPYQGSLPSGH